MEIKGRIKELAKQLSPRIIDFRRHIHANPELSFQEYKTSEFVESTLKSFGITSIKKIAGTGLLAEIKGRNPGKKTFALRADMDALPIQEKNEVPYKSNNPGVMHACGHDVHTSSLLGCAAILSQLTDQFEGTVKLLFQPGEEVAPGGASIMIKEGALKNPDASGIVGQHVMPQLEAGKIGFREGMYMASADELYITVHGKGGHGAMPDFNIDPVVISAHIIVALQQIVSRMANPKIPTVLSFGKVIADGATNVIPDKVYIEGTFRTLNEAWRKDAHKKMVKLAESIAEGMGGRCEFKVVNGYPFLVNEPELTRRARQAAVDYLGEENIVDLDLWMAAEDFAYYTHEIPGCFYRLGVRNEAKGITSSVHTPTFNIDENALETGAGLMAWLTVKELAD
jgi:amidohydrolase